MSEAHFCTTRRCENVAIVEATEVRGTQHRYCIDHLWQIEESDQVRLTDGSVQPGAQPRAAAVELPVTIAEPVFNEQGFSVGFRIVHPPGVECVFPPGTKQCSCGKMDLGVVKASDPVSTEQSPDQS